MCVCERVCDEERDEGRLCSSESPRVSSKANMSSVCADGRLFGSPFKRQGKNKMKLQKVDLRVSCCSHGLIRMG